MSNINWDKSYLLTAEQVGLLGLNDISVTEIGSLAGTTSVPGLAQLAEAMDNLSVADLARWNNK